MNESFYMHPRYNEFKAFIDGLDTDSRINPNSLNLAFDVWLKKFKIYALNNKISESTFDMAMSNVVFLPKVIKYDRFQPDFYENTKTYVTKRSSKKGIANSTAGI